MQIPSIGAEAVLNTMRDQIAQLRGSDPQLVQQIEVQASEKLATLQPASSGSKGSRLNVSA